MSLKYLFPILSSSELFIKGERSKKSQGMIENCLVKWKCIILWLVINREV